MELSLVPQTSNLWKVLHHWNVAKLHVCNPWGNINAMAHSEMSILYWYTKANVSYNSIYFNASGVEILFGFKEFLFLSMEFLRS